MPRRKAQEVVEPEGGWKVVGKDSPEAYPLCVVFDLDYTLWDLWIDTHITPPLKRKGDTINSLVDRRGQILGFYNEVPTILAELRKRKIHIAAASRTSAPELAREALGMLLIPDENGKIVKSIEYFNTMEIYPGSKLRHFREIHRRTGIPYEQMVRQLGFMILIIKLFFDDEHRNFEVESLGVTMCLVESRGTDLRLFKDGLGMWRKRRGLQVEKD